MPNVEAVEVSFNSFGKHDKTVHMMFGDVLGGRSVRSEVEQANPLLISS